jgi:GrpB-like predicted nucleotidyltransferase (UPF0157 family)
MTEDADTVRFDSESVFRSRVAAAFADCSRQLGCLLPNARVEHVGSTAVPESITKGDLDICVIVGAADFAEALKRLEHEYARNTGSDRTEYFAAFVARSAGAVDIGVQLVVAGSPLDVFVRWRDLLLANASLRRQYDDLKRRHHGASMHQYRREKSAFIEAALAATAGAG